MSRAQLLPDALLDRIAKRVTSVAPEGWIDPVILLAVRGVEVFATPSLCVAAEALASEATVYYLDDDDPYIVRRRQFLGLAALLLLEASLDHDDGDVRRLAALLDDDLAPTSRPITAQTAPISSTAP